MPWHLLVSPSIQIGSLQAALDAAGIPARSHSFHLAFPDFLLGAGLAQRTVLEDYERVSVGWSNLGVGEWLFAVEPHRTPRPGVEEGYRAFLLRNGLPKPSLARLQRLRRLVPAFLARCADEVLAGAPRVVGFTVVYSQLWPSVALASELVRRAPGLKIVFGGASCEGPMGPAVLRAFPAVDLVVRGEGEAVVPPVMRALLAGEEAPRLPGLCRRGPEGEREVARVSGPSVDLRALGVPAYDEYFERLRGSALAGAFLPQVPFESSRGCWWGEKHHCTFCGLNGLDMRHRSKAPEQLLEELDTLAARHEVLDFTAVDNILDMRFFDTLLPSLVARGRDLSLFYETKANLGFEHVQAFQAAGVRTIQPGIESLSSPTLRLMRKGVTALQNVRLLKWSARLGIHVIWNLLYGFPREDPAEYARMAELVPSLAHFAPPELVRLMVYRFSPYHEEPALHGLRLTGPLPYLAYLHDVDEATRADLTQAFDFRYEDGRDPEAYVGALRERIAHWRRDAERNRGALTYRRGPGFLVITDTRTTTTRTPVRYTLGAREAEVYLACEAGATPRSLAALGSPEARLPAAELETLLADLAAARLVVRLDGRVLALAQPLFSEARPEGRRPRASGERA